MIAALAALSLVLGLCQWLVSDLPGLDHLRVNTPSIRILDRHGYLLYEVIDEGRHSIVPLSDIPEACIDATIATEDASFYTNPGISLRGMMRALWLNLTGGEVVAGGSTITQQVARNHLMDADKQNQQTMRRKLREVILAYRLNHH
jgi:membrane peptidoglycan carboxypeptidase